MKKIWSIRPQGTSAKNWSPDLIGAAVISFEWIAQGFTAVSFWTAPNRLARDLSEFEFGAGRPVVASGARAQRSDRPDGVRIGLSRHSF